MIYCVSELLTYNRSNADNTANDVNDIVFFKYWHKHSEQCTKHADGRNWDNVSPKEDCPICLMKMNDVDNDDENILTCCGHYFHKHCIKCVIEHEGYAYKCPYCRHKGFMMYVVS